MARNLAIEKRRREELNEDFVNLARLLPGLAHARRLSKVSIVKESIRHLKQQREMCLAAGRDMQELLSENNRLVSEVNGLRSQVWGPTMPLSAPRPMTDTMARLIAVKNEIYGEFPVGYGDNWAYNARHMLPDMSDSAQIVPEETESSPNAWFRHHGQHHIQQDVPREPGVQEYENTLAPDVTQLAHGCSLGPSPCVGGQTTTSGMLLPDLFAPDCPPIEDFISLNNLDYLSEPVEESLNDICNYSWNKDITLGLNSHHIPSQCTGTEVQANTVS
ncbi:basic helix-loop-helix domain-containing protein [Aspergillus undulatus]|uniref:basic helix-loop-helix domain-containing protein n=1 Tax=Aspergillus undulatus TaxID=1810928 RepID=UPI003CCD2620